MVKKDPSFEEAVYYIDSDIHVVLSNDEKSSFTAKASIGLLENSIVIRFSPKNKDFPLYSDNGDFMRFRAKCSHSIQTNPYVDMTIGDNKIRGFILRSGVGYKDKEKLDIYMQPVVNKLEITPITGRCSYSVLEFGKDVEVKEIFKFSALLNYDIHLDGVVKLF